MKVRLENLDIAACQRGLILALETCPSLDAVERDLGVSPRAPKRLLVKHKLTTRARGLKRTPAIQKPAKR